MDAEGVYLFSIGGEVKTQESRTSTPVRKMTADVTKDAEKLRKTLKELETTATELEERTSKSEGWWKDVLNKNRIARFSDPGTREPYRETTSQPYRMAYAPGSYVSPFLGA